MKPAPFSAMLKPGADRLGRIVLEQHAHVGRSRRFAGVAAKAPGITMSPAAIAHAEQAGIAHEHARAGMQADNGCASRHVIPAACANCAMLRFP